MVKVDRFLIEKMLPKNHTRV